MPAIQTHRAAPRFQRLLSHRLDRPLGGAVPSSSSGGTCPFAAATRQAPSTLSRCSLPLSPPTFFAPTFLRIQTLNQSFPFRLSPLLPLQQSPVSAHLTRIFVLSSSVTPAQDSSRLAHNRLPSLRAAGHQLQKPFTTPPSLSPAKTPQPDRRLFAAAGPTLSSHPNTFFPRDTPEHPSLCPSKISRPSVRCVDAC